MKSMYKTLLEMTKDTDLSSYAKHVFKWNDIARQARGGTMGRYIPYELQWSFVEEEFDELLKALREDDRKEVIDAALDLFVVSSYAFILDQMTKQSASAAGALEHIREYCGFNCQKHFSLVDLECGVYGTRDSKAVLEMVVCLCFRLDMNLGYNMQQVLSSNDSKYPTFQQVAESHSLSDVKNKDSVIDAECRAIEDKNGGRYQGVYAKQIGDFYVFFDNNHKIMKPTCWKAPRIIV